MDSVPIAAVEGTSAVVKAYYVLGIFFWAAFVTSLTSISSAESLKTYASFVDAIDPVYVAVIAGLLPSIILLALMNLLPLFFQWVSLRIVHKKSWSEIQQDVLEW